MAKNKIPAPAKNGNTTTATPESENTEPNTTPHKPKNALLMPWLVVFVSALIVSAGIIAWIELSFSPEINNHSRESYQALFTDSVNDVISKTMTSTQKEIDTIATNEHIKSALVEQNTMQLAAISSAIASSFNNVVSFQIIPWDLTGTAGLKAHNIEPRNNTELMLLSQAGNKKPTTAEAYLHEKVWYISFSSPVIQDGNVIGVLLLTFNKDYLGSIIKTPAFTGEAKFTFYLKSQKAQPIISIGTGSSAQSRQLPMAFTEGELDITFNDEKLQNLQLSFLPVYIAIGSLVALLLVMVVTGYRICCGLIRKDAESIRNYAESLSALHKTKQPELLISSLSSLVNAIDSLSERTTKTGMISEVKDDYKSPQATKAPEKPALATVAEKNQFEHPDIFRDYDIRGIADTQLNSDAVVMIGKAIGSEALALGIQTIITARDGRLSSERIQYDLSRGIISTGCNVINLGQAPTPALYYATIKLETGSGVMVTGSHNPAEYNGLKIVLDNKTLHGNEIQNLLKRIENYDFAQGQGKITKQDISPDYIQDISSDIIVARPLNVVIDAGNGVGGNISTQLLTMLDCHVTSLYCEIDGNFPNHGPDPSIRANLTDLINKVQETNADLGIAFDGDADRIVAITSTGQVINGDQLLMLFARDIVSRNAGSTVVYDVKCSRLVEKLVSAYGGRTIMTRSGHSNIKAKMQETGALLGGEFTGHFFFKERWNGFDDGIYAALRLIEILSTGSTTLDEEIATLSVSFSTNELNISVSNSQQALQIVAKVKAALALESCKIDETDGVRAEFDKGWGLIRSSNTSSSLSLRFEAATEEELARIQALFKTALNNLNLNLSIPF